MKMKETMQLGKNSFPMRWKTCQTGSKNAKDWKKKLISNNVKKLNEEKPPLLTDGPRMQTEKYHLTLL